MALSTAARRAIAIRNSIAKRASNDNQPKPVRRAKAMPAGLLADCVAAGGFDQNASYAS